MTDERSIHQDFLNLVKRHLHNLSICNEGRRCSGYVDNEEQYSLFFDDLKALGFSFSTENSKIHKHSRILFSFTKNGSDIQIPYFGSPFQILKTSYMICSQGGNYRPQSPLPTMTDNFCAKKRRFSMQPTKKIGCKAFMTVKCIRVYDDKCYKPKSLARHKDGSYESRMIMNRLNKDLLSSSPPTRNLRFMILMSSAKEHNHTIVSTNLNQIIHSKLREEIYQVAKVNSACSVKQMQSHLERIVKQMFEDKGRPQPNALNRCYYPTETTLRFHMRQAGFLIKQQKHQPEDLDQCIVIQTLKSENDFTSDLDTLGYFATEHGVQYCWKEMKYATQDEDNDKKALNQCIVIHTASSNNVCNSVFDSDENKEPNIHLNYSADSPTTRQHGQQKSSVDQCIVIESHNHEGEPSAYMNIDSDRDEVDKRFQLPPSGFVAEDTDEESTVSDGCVIITASDAKGYLTYDTDSIPYVEDLSTPLAEVEVPVVAKKRKYRDKYIRQCIEVRGTESHVHSSCDSDFSQYVDGADLEECSEVRADKNREELVEHYVIINAANSEDGTDMDIDSAQDEKSNAFGAADHDLISDPNKIENGVTANDWHRDANIADVKKLWYQTRENLKVIMRYTYENHTPESVFEIAQLTQQLKNKVLASASESSVTFVPVKSQRESVTGENTLKPFSNICVNIPTQKVLQTGGKYID